ncbi:MAG: hypothetical protein M0C28_32505 [Candidatus Moduliflexus flocculans]|nr:hypothetical protein [Candidatus Moduliflexus flocculans]
MSASGLAQRCDARPPQSQFAREDLRRAATEGDLATAQDFADRARRGLDRLAGVAARCACAPAQAKVRGRFRSGAPCPRRGIAPRTA